MVWLKADFHIHTNKDPYHTFISYDPFQLIDILQSKGFEVAAITHHDEVYEDKKLKDYAQSKGVILFTGCEKTIQKKHVLLININNNLAQRINTFQDLEREKKRHPEMLVIAPHPFLPIKEALHSKLKKNISLFDALEISHFYTRIFTFNTKTKHIAKKYNIPLIGTSDAHSEIQIGRTYTLINAKKDKRSIINAIKKGMVECVSKPLPILTALFLTIKLYWMTKKEEKLKEIMKLQRNIIKRVKNVRKRFNKTKQNIKNEVFK